MTVPNNTNEDLAIKDEAVRYIWAGWFIFVFSSSLVGDTIILIASIKYEAIALPEVMVAFIQHIAVSDLVICISYIFPLAVSLVDPKIPSKISYLDCRNGSQDLFADLAASPFLAHLL